MIEFGGEFQEFIKRQNLPVDSEKLLTDSATRILLRTELLDGGKSANCQLVVGEVQSGKTMSFTSVIALAHENGFPLVIVLAGTKNLLLMQTQERLKFDLRADGDGGANPWVFTPKLKKSEREENLKDVQSALNIWVEVDAPKTFKPTVVMTCLKNRESLDEISHIVSGLSSRFNINDFPVLIIDDEGDQAGLNLRWADDEESPIYAAIGRLRNSLSRHSYIMYTATPQGPLLVDIQDALSPKYVTLLQSGSNYLGGQDLFYSDNSFVKYIPNFEHDQIFNEDLSATVPKSLKDSLAYYLLALYVAQNRALPKPISMLVHPSSLRRMHNTYERWVKSVLASWHSVLRDPSEQIYEYEKSEFFIRAENELKKTVKLPIDWNLDVALGEIRWWISKVEIRKVNSDGEKIKPDEWKSKAGWIVIGGNNLERGFTIENLVVTYMPRSPGGGNMDVIQQRGRFFGYKRPYLDLLRGWFFQDKAQAYLDYVTHEESIRSQLKLIDSNNEQLSVWRRRFLIDPSYNPVRKQVLSLGVVHKRLSIFKQHMLFEPNLSTNRDAFLKSIYSRAENLKPMIDDKRKGTLNFYAELEIQDALEILVDWPMTSNNRSELDDTIWALRLLVDEGELSTASLVFMDWNPQKGEQRIRDRSMLHKKPNKNLLPEEQVIANIFQGPDSNSAGNYPGDSAMTIVDSLTIQVHRVRPFYGEIGQPDVVALGLIIPPNKTGFMAENPGRAGTK